MKLIFPEIRGCIKMNSEFHKATKIGGQATVRSTTFAVGLKVKGHILHVI
jgi:hypothetical protein